MLKPKACSASAKPRPIPEPPPVMKMVFDRILMGTSLAGASKERRSSPGRTPRTAREGFKTTEEPETVLPWSVPASRLAGPGHCPRGFGRRITPSPARIGTPGHRRVRREQLLSILLDRPCGWATILLVAPPEGDGLFLYWVLRDVRCPCRSGTIGALTSALARMIRDALRSA